MGFSKNHPVTEQKKGFTREEVNRIDRALREKKPLIELVLFHVGIDTMLRVSDLMRLKVSDLVQENNEIKEIYLVKQKKTGEKVEVILHPSTRKILKTYLEADKKARTDYLFTSKRSQNEHLSPWWMRQKVKKWVKLINLPSEYYSCHSLRRTGAIHLYYASNKDLEIVRQALGQSSIEATKHYLGIESLRVKEVLLNNPMWQEANTLNHSPLTFNEPNKFEIEIPIQVKPNQPLEIHPRYKSGKLYFEIILRNEKGVLELA